jgi:predicted MFS family arabinose efflux permease
MIAVSGIDVALLALSRDSGRTALAGVYAAVWAIGSMVGGAVSVYAPNRLSSVPARRVSWLAAGAALLLPAVASGRPSFIAAALAAGGTAIAPALAAVYHTVARVSTAARRGEAFGWLATGITAGASLGAPLSGAVYDAAGPVTAVGAAVGAAALASLLLTTVPAPEARSHH